MERPPDVSPPKNPWVGVLLTLGIVPLVAFPFFHWFLLPLTIGSHGRRGMNLSQESLDAIASPDGQAVLMGTSVFLTAVVTVLLAIAMYRDARNTTDPPDSMG